MKKLHEQKRLAWSFKEKNNDLPDTDENKNICLSLRLLFIHVGRLLEGDLLLKLILILLVTDRYAKWIDISAMSDARLDFILRLYKIGARNYLEQYCSTKPLRRPFINLRFNSSSAGDQETSKTYSSSHQESRRKAYEQKRYDFEGNSHKYDRTALIQPMPENHYQRLNVDTDADSDTIKSAYYTLTKLYHPDIIGSDSLDDTENFRLVTESYDVLIDPNTRAEYDRQLKLHDTNKNLDMILNESAKTTYEDPGSLYRTRSADLIFKMRHEALLEREKLLNPKKFRAGSFKTDIDDRDMSTRISRMRNLTSPSRTAHGDDFYRIHLQESVRRRIEGFDTSQKSRDLNDNMLASILSIMGLVVVVGYFVLGSLYDVDIAAALDRQLERRCSSKSEETD